MSDQDSVWKEIIDAYFDEFIAFFFPAIYQDIDWSKGYEFLDKELEKIVQDSELGKRLVDKLVKVYLSDGSETWLLIHIEIQGNADQNFEERMFIYNYRIFDRYHQNVVSLAILTDTNRKFRPKGYEFKRWGFELSFKFPVIKLIDYNKNWAALEANPNPFAVVVMSQLKARQVKSPDQLLSWKLRLIRMLYDRKYSRQQIINLFRFIDWLIRLPEELEQTFEDRLAEYEGTTMPYVTSIERRATERALQQGKQELVLRQLKRRVGELEPELEQQVKVLSIEQLEELGEALLDFTDVAQLKDWLQNKGTKE